MGHLRILKDVITNEQIMPYTNEHGVVDNGGNLAIPTLRENTEVHFNENSVKYVSKNLINPATKNKLENLYVEYSSGRVGSVSGFTTFIIPIDSSKKVLNIYGGRNSHLSFFDRYVAPLNAEPMANLSGYISGVTLNSGGEISVNIPSNAVCMCLSCNTERVGVNIVASYGNQVASYVDYNKVINDDYNLYVGHNMPYTTIQEAVDNAVDGATIHIMNGVYNEYVNLIDSGKTLHLVGESRDGCVIEYSSGDYTKPPLEITKGSVENMTIHATGTTLNAGASMRAYCVHIDDDSAKGSSLQFRNVAFVNDSPRECVGVGLRQGYKLSFVGCSFISQNCQAVYCHEGQDNDVTNQYIEFIDCSIYRNNTGSNGGCAILLQQTTGFVNNHATIMFQRCLAKSLNGMKLNGEKIIKCVDYPENVVSAGGSGYLGSRVFTLHGMSGMNNYSELDSE